VLARSVYLCTPIVLIATVADALAASSSIAATEPFVARVLLAAKLACYLLLPAAVIGVALAFVASSIRPLLARVRGQRVLVFDGSIESPDAANAATLAFAVFFGTVAALGLYLTRTVNNQEVVAFSIAVAATAAVPLCALLGLLLLGAFGRLRRATEARFPQLGPRWRFAPAVAILILCVITVMLVNRATLKQVKPWAASAPVAALAAFFALRPRYRGRSLESTGVARLQVSGIVMAALGTFLAALSNPELPNLWMQSGALGSRVIRVARALTDFDRDGYSSLFGGGDCAPFDARVHPGAVEIPGDGIDNNCVAGDSSAVVTSRRPAWFEEVPASVPKDLNVVLVTVEAFRADHASFIGAKRDTTPFLRELAKDAVVFENMFAGAPITRLSIPSLLSSCNPSEIDWELVPKKLMHHVKPSTPWLPEILQKAGLRTIAVHTDFRAFTDVEPVGFERGFSRYDTSTHLTYTGGTMRGFPSAAQIDKAKNYLGELSAERFFLWLHLVEPHYAYERAPGAPDFGSDDQALYDAEVWEVDRQIGRLVSYLRERGLWERTLFFVTGDHGEEFGEHGQKWHGTNIYQPQVHPAALLYVPGLSPARVRVPTSFTDVVPTIVNLLRLKEGFGALRNRNLTSYLAGGELPGGPVLVENFQFTEGASKNYALTMVRWPRKLIYVEEGQSFELYDLERDPGETHRLPLSSDAAHALQLELFGYLEGAARRNISGAISTR
jgi:arylsulfatase A-like enzyme